MDSNILLNRLKAAKANGSFIDIGNLIEELESEPQTADPGTPPPADNPPDQPAPDTGKKSASETPAPAGDKKK